jgi:hypothetical protein
MKKLCGRSVSRSSKQRDVSAVKEIGNLKSEIDTDTDPDSEKSGSFKGEGENERRTFNIELRMKNIQIFKSLYHQITGLEFTAPSSYGPGIFDFSVGFEGVSKYQSVKVLNIRANCKSQNQRR